VLTLEAITNITEHAIAETIPTQGYLHFANCRRFLPSALTQYEATENDRTLRDVARPNGDASHLDHPNVGVQVGDQLSVGNGQTFRPVPPSQAAVTAVDAVAKTLQLQGKQAHTERGTLGPFVRTDLA